MAIIVQDMLRRCISFFSLLFIPLLLLASGDKRESMRVIAPLGFYTPETGFAGGGAFIMIWNIRPGVVQSTPNQLNMIAYYTQKHQYVLDANTEVYHGDGRLRIFVSGNYKKFPDMFWGTGKHTTDNAGEEYTQVETTLFGNPAWTVFSHLRLGPYYRFSRFRVTETEEGGVLSGSEMIGYPLALVSGIGGEILWDVRDTIFYPSRGTFIQLRYVLYHGIWGSRQEYSQVECDARHYLRTFREQVLALQCKGAFANGEVPFQLLPRLGGSTIMRGMYDGRYRDQYSLAAQAEYRVPLFWRFGAVVFGSIGQVFSPEDQFAWEDCIAAFGAGGRFSIMEQQRVNCRFDIGFCEDEIAIYFKYQEAF